MPDNTDILIRALEASGSEREAKLARAILGKQEAPAEPAAAAETPAAATPEIGSAANPGLPASDVQPPAVGPQPPPGKAPLQNLDEVERLPLQEQVARMAEIDALIESGAK